MPERGDSLSATDIRKRVEALPPEHALAVAARAAVRSWVVFGSTQRGYGIWPSKTRIRHAQAVEIASLCAFGVALSSQETTIESGINLDTAATAATTAATTATATPYTPYTTDDAGGDEAAVYTVYAAADAVYAAADADAVYAPAAANSAADAVAAAVGAAERSSSQRVSSILRQAIQSDIENSACISTPLVIWFADKKATDFIEETRWPELRRSLPDDGDEVIELYIHLLTETPDVSRVLRTLEKWTKPDRIVAPIDGPVIIPTKPTHVGKSIHTGQEASEDHLSFSPYLKALVTFFSNPQTEPPLIVSVEGEWGTGKSSFLNFLASDIQGIQDANFKIVKFNPWRHEAAESMWGAFALSIQGQLLAHDSWRERSKKHFRLVWTRFQSGFRLSKILPVLSQAIMWLIVIALAGWLAFSYLDLPPDTAKDSVIVGLVGVLAVFLRMVAPYLGNPLKVDLEKIVDSPKYAEQTTLIHQFHQDLRTMLRIYAGEDATVVVIVDDLDRCDVPTAAELLRSLNLFISSGQDECAKGKAPNLFGVLGIDREKVAAGIAAKHREILPWVTDSAPLDGEVSRENALRFGYRYLEKFIQLTVSLPTPNRDNMRDLIASLCGGAAPKSIEQKKARIAATQTASSDPAGPEGASPDPGTTQPRPVKSEEPEKPSRAPQRPTEKGAKLANVRIEAFFEDSDDFQELVLLAAPALGNNPRRVTQLVNLLRFRFYIAAETGVFRADADDDDLTSLTLPQLAKLTAIELISPRLAITLRRDSQLLSRNIESLPEERGDSIKEESQLDAQLAEILHSRPGVRNLIVAGTDDLDTQEAYSLTRSCNLPLFFSAASSSDKVLEQALQAGAATDADDTRE